MNEINSFIQQFTDKEIKNIKLDHNTYYLEQNPNKTPLKPISPGIIIGTKGKTFKPSLYLLELLSKLSTNKIYINDKSEWLFLCGRDVFDKSITKDTSNGKIFLVQNQKNENLGYAKRVKDGKNILIKNYLDRGDFLRRER